MFGRDKEVEPKPSTDEQKVLNELSTGFKDASTEENSKSNSPLDAEPVKPPSQLNTAVVKSIVWGGNVLTHKLATRDVPPEIAELVKPIFKTTDQEVELTKEAINAHANDLFSPEVIELMNKYGAFGPLLQFKADQYNQARVEIKLALAELNKTKGNS